MGKSGFSKIWSYRFDKFCYTESYSVSPAPSAFMNYASPLQLIEVMTYGQWDFHVEFRASTGDFGDGLVVVKDGAVNGGDPHYLYQGEVPTQSGDFESRFIVRKYRDGNVNVVGIDNYTLLARGRVDYEGGTIELRGAVEEHPQLTLQLRGRKIQPAV